MRLVADQMAASAEKARLIDDLRQANAALTASNAELERQYADLLEARRIKDEFLSNISHELRTPLTAVIGYISLMQEGLAGPVNVEQQETLGAVKDSSEQLLSLIGDLLELTALKRGAVDTDLVDLDPRQPMRDAIAEARGRRDHVQLDVSEPAEVPVMHTDRRTVAKAIKALLENAYKFTRDGTVRAAVEVVGNRVVYSVTDTGIGIPLDAQSLIFEEFRQADGTHTRRFGGSGLGLSLARRLARLVKGDISLVSAPGAGSTFRLDVPLRFGQDHRDDSHESVAAHASGNHDAAERR
jgi:signal transduction histidine kinase